LRDGGHTKQLEIPVKVVPNYKNEQLLFVTLDFNPCKRCSDCRNILLERSDLIPARVVSPKAMIENKQ